MLTCPLHFASLTGCIGGPPATDFTEIVAFGPLPAGTHTYEIYIDDEEAEPELRSRQELVVVQALSSAAVPVISPWSRITMIGIFAALACVMLVRPRP